MSSRNAIKLYHQSHSIKLVLVMAAPKQKARFCAPVYKAMLGFVEFKVSASTGEIALMAHAVSINSVIRTSYVLHLNC